mmetsp:Transcript_16045/g.43403  ORF Transcript_16045/g.43403 Transcript_16045/m.43403 type:complete len:236 (+) Transcript_16045:1399-2106(+)
MHLCHRTPAAGVWRLQWTTRSTRAVSGNRGPRPLHWRLNSLIPFLSVERVVALRAVRTRLNESRNVGWHFRRLMLAKKPRARQWHLGSISNLPFPNQRTATSKSKSVTWKFTRNPEPASYSTLSNWMSRNVISCQMNLPNPCLWGSLGTILATRTRAHCWCLRKNWVRILSFFDPYSAERHVSCRVEELESGEPASGRVMRQASECCRSICRSLDSWTFAFLVETSRRQAVPGRF